jgi:hypothetical protein
VEGKDSKIPDTDQLNAKIQELQERVDHLESVLNSPGVQTLILLFEAWFKASEKYLSDMEDIKQIMEKHNPKKKEEKQDEK